MKPLLSILLFLSLLAGAQKPDSLVDGPYVFYKGNHMEILTVDSGSVRKQQVAVSEKGRQVLRVPVTGASCGYFPVLLKESIKEPPSEYKGADKLFVISDIEGEFHLFTSILQAAGVVNDKMEWSFGNGHLVVCGDVMDRGSEVTAVLWLLYKLESEAAAAGGGMHLVMGNHEVMNLSDDIRYVHPKYLEVATLAGLTYTDLFTADTELGRWLRTRNCMEKIGSYLFVHGGISQEVNNSGYSISRINKKAKALYDKDGYEEQLRKANAEVIFHTATSPFWYRGYFTSPGASEAQVDSTLDLYSVNTIFVGHTLVDAIQKKYKGKVIALDVASHQGKGEGLLINGREMVRINNKGERLPLQ